MIKRILIDLSLQLFNIVSFVLLATVHDEVEDVEGRLEKLAIANGIFGQLAVLTRQLDKVSVHEEARIAV